MQLATRAGRGPVMQFGDFKNPFADKRDGATTVSLTLAFNCVERGPGSILTQLDGLAANADTSDTQGLSELTTKTALALLRRKNEWLMCCGSAQHKGDEEEALSIFDRLAISEAAKFDDRDVSSSVDAALAAAGVGGASKDTMSTIAVVCVLATLLGDREEQITKSFNGDAAKMAEALQEVAAAGNADEEVYAFELFWVPGEDSEVLQMEEVNQDWPELIQC